MNSKKKGGWMSVDEFLDKLNSDPAFVARRDIRERERQQREAELRHAEEPLIEALRGAGISVESVWSLLDTSADYSAALPILFEHLERPYPSVVREGIARALAVPQSRPSLEHLIRLYKSETDSQPKDGLAVAIASVADEDALDDVIALVRDQRLGESRLLLLSVLEETLALRGRAVLEEMQEDPDLRKEIRVILRRLDRKRSSSRPGRETPRSPSALSAARSWLASYAKSWRAAPDRRRPTHEASMNFDMENVPPFLTRLNDRLQLGLPVPELVAATRDAPVERESAKVLSVRFNGNPVQLEYRVFMDDVDAPDLYFLTDSQALAVAIDRQMKEFAEELGI